MGADSLENALVVAEYVGTPLSDRQQEQLVIFHTWLLDEATRAGGIGPHEEDRLWNRHIADSLLFGVGLSLAQNCIDIGTGAGLPGIPLAIAYPNIDFVLLDRSGRRCDLVRRISAVLDLSNCEVIQADVKHVAMRFDALVSRAAIPPDEMMIHVKRILNTPGTAVLGLSRVGRAKNLVVEVPGFTVSMLTVPSKVLDSGAELLRIEAT